jgi:hypothetical protein
MLKLLMQKLEDYSKKKKRKKDQKENIIWQKVGVMKLYQRYLI